MRHGRRLGKVAAVAGSLLLAGGYVCYHAGLLRLPRSKAKTGAAVLGVRPGLAGMPPTATPPGAPPTARPGKQPTVPSLSGGAFMLCTMGREGRSRVLMPSSKLGMISLAPQLTAPLSLPPYTIVPVGFIEPSASWQLAPATGTFPSVTRPAVAPVTQP